MGKGKYNDSGTWNGWKGGEWEGNEGKGREIEEGMEENRGECMGVDGGNERLVEGRERNAGSRKEYRE